MIFECGCGQQSINYNFNGRGNIWLEYGYNTCEVYYQMSSALSVIYTSL